jgi:type I restriction enzyme S subunit
MASEWPQLPLGDVMTLQRGFDLPSQDRKPGKVPIVSSSGVSDYHSEVGVKGPGVVTGRYGTIGKVFLIKEDYWPLNTTLWVKDFHGNDPYFASYLLRTIDFKSCCDKSSVPGVNRNDLHRIPVLIPPLAEQKAIASILGALDDKIELNRRMNATLEAMARALFQSWFVDFDPVRAKLDGCKPEGLDKATAALFPEQLEDSPLGNIPKGWEVKSVGTIGEVICGKTPPTSVADYYGNDIPFITIPDMHGNVFGAATARKLSHAGAKSQANKTLPPGSLCVSCIATPGLVVITSEYSQTNQQINSVVPHQKDETYFWYWVMTGLGAEIASSGSGGSVLVNLSKGRFETLQLIKPPHPLIRTYHNTVSPLFEAIHANTLQSRTLATLRDTLLPKLLSGELSVASIPKVKA